MTTKVVKGSLWTLAGQVAPLAFSLIATPFVIRMLSSEAYGVLILVALIPTYLGFADFGMSLASTKFGSKAYAEGDPEKEARVVRTAALITLLAATPIAILIFAFSYQISAFFNVPEHLHAEAALALKFAAVTFVVNFLNGVINTPQLARLRMDLNTFATSGFRILGIIATPLVIYLGYGIVGATLVLLLAGILTLTGHSYISSRLLPDLKGFSIDRDSFRPLLKFGGALVLSGIAAVLLVNLEKLVLVRTTSVEILAYYSVAFSLAMIATMFSQAMIQSLIPAFSQLLSPEKHGQMQGLFSRSLRLIIIALVPTLAFLFVAARPIFVYMGGEDFGRESTWPFRILLFGLLFNVMAYTPFSVLMATGRSDLFAKLYWIELLPYIGLIALLTARYGAIGAATAWSIRVIADAFIIGGLAIRSVGISFAIFQGKGWRFATAALLFLPSVVIAALISEHFAWLFLIFTISLVVYGFTVWTEFVEIAERAWLSNKVAAFVGQEKQKCH